MAMGTAPHQPNPTMRPAPMGKPPSRAEAQKAAADEAKARMESQQKALDAGEPWLDENDDGVDWVALYRCYPHAKSKDELRSLALAGGKEALTMAAEAIANADLPVVRTDSDEPNKPAEPPAPPPPPPNPPHQPAHH